MITPTRPISKPSRAIPLPTQDEHRVRAVLIPQVATPRALEASDFWDGTKAVEWDVHPRNILASAARYFRLPVRQCQDGNIRFITTPDQLAWVIAFAQRHTGDPQPMTRDGKRNL